MKTNFIFVLKEGVEGLGRGVFYSFIAVAASALAVFVLGLFAYSAVNLQRAAEDLLSALQFEAFVSPAVPESLHTELEKVVQALDSRWKIAYISRDEAAAVFAKEFDPELFDVLKENPLPASFRINLPPQAMCPDSAKVAAERLLAVDGIDDVIYDREIINMFHSGSQKLTRWGLVIGCLAVLLAVGLSFNSLRLKIRAQREAMNLMSLLGATPGALRAVHWAQGAILGSMGGLLGAALILFAAALIQFRLVKGVEIAIPHPYLPVVAGCILGMLGGLLAVGRYLRG